MKKVPKMACSKKPDSSSKKTCSHTKNGKSYFKNTGRYNEVTKAGAALLLSSVSDDDPSGLFIPPCEGFFVKRKKQVN